MSTKPPGRRPNVFTPFLRRFTDERAHDLRSTVTLYDRVKAKFEKSVWSQPDMLEKMASYLLSCIKPAPPEVLREAFLDTIRELLRLEAAVFVFPDYQDPSSRTLSLQDQVNLRRFLRAKEHFLDNDDHITDLLGNAIISILSETAENLPDIHDGSQLKVPLHVLAKNLPRTVNHIVAVAVSEELHNAGMCIALCSAVHDNLYRISGITPGEKTKRKVVFADEYDGDPIDYLRGTPLQNLFAADVPFMFANRFAHHHVLAGTGGGKTNLYGGMIHADFDAVAAGKASVIVLDSQGMLVPTLARMPDFAPGGRLHGRLVYIDPTDIEHPLALNIFARNRKRARTPMEKRTEHANLLDLLLFLFAAMKQETTGRQETLLRAVTTLILEIPNATLTTLNKIFDPRRNALVAFDAYISQLDPDTQEFFRTDFGGGEFAETRAQIRARLQSLITDPVFNSMFSAPTQELDFAAEMDAGKVILINAHEDLLKSQTEIFGRFFIALAKNAAQGRSHIPEAQRMPTYFYIDECYKYIKADANVEKIFDTGRQYRMGIVIAHQRYEQLNSALRSAASQAAIKMVRDPIDDDINAAARQLRTTPAWLQTLPQHTFGVFQTGMTTAAPLKIPLSPLANAKLMTDAEFAVVREEMRRKYARRAGPGPQAPDPQPEPSGPPTPPPRPTGAASEPVPQSGDGDITTAKPGGYKK